MILSHLVPFLLFALCDSFLVTRSSLRPAIAASSTLRAQRTAFLNVNWLEKMMFWKTPSSSTQLDNTSFVDESNLRKILVFGSTGRSGYAIVTKLLENENNLVVLAVKNETKALAAFVDMPSRLRIHKDCDILDSSTLTTQLFNGVSTVISAIGPSFNNATLSSENVDYLGNVAIMKAMAARSSKKESFSSTIITSFKKGARDMSLWSRLDDVIMVSLEPQYLVAVDADVLLHLGRKF